MQPNLPVALPTSITATPLIGKLQLGPADFGGELAKLLAAIAPAATTVAPKTNATPATAQSPTMAPAQAPPASVQQSAPDLLATETPLPIAALSLTQGSEPASSVAQPQTNTAGVRSRTSPAARREPAKSAASVLPTTAPVIVDQSSTVMPIVVPPAVDVPAQAASPPVHEDTGGPHKPIAVSKPEPPQPTAALPSDPRPAVGEAAPANVDAPAAIPAAVTALAQNQSAAITLAPPISPTDPTSAPSTPVTPTTTPVATAAPPPSPAAQIAPALISMTHAPDGTQRLTMKLEPPDLGQVQIRIDRPTTDTPAHVAITVEKAETLTLLLRDQPQLQRALDQAGVPAEGRSVTFHVATPAPAARTDTATAPQPTGSMASMGWRPVAWRIASGRAVHAAECGRH